jgi:MAF protein
MGVESSKSAEIVLASESPRRRRLVQALDTPVTAISPESEEGPPLMGETPAAFVTRLSAKKAEAVARQAVDAIVLGADTAVVLDGAVLGKPVDSRDAARMLRLLRGRMHAVITGLTTIDARSGQRLSAVMSTEVRMRRYSDEEIAAYVESGAPMDKAGAYAIQDTGFSPAAETAGCYLNVVGLPLCEVVNVLEKLGVSVRLSDDSGATADCQQCPLDVEREGSVP